MTTSATAPDAARRGRGRPKGGTTLVDRDQLISAAERAIVAIGADATMDQIAAEAAVTKPILYRTIGDKEAVIDVLSDVLVDRIARVIADAVGEGSDPQESFTESIRAYLTTVEANRNLYSFINAAGQRPESVRARVDRSAQQLVEIFAAEQGATARATSPLTWAHSIVGALQTVTLMWIGDERRATAGDGRTVDDLSDDVSRLLWPGMAAILGLDSTA